MHVDRTIRSKAQATGRRWLFSPTHQGAVSTDPYDSGNVPVLSRVAEPRERRVCNGTVTQDQSRSKLGRVAFVEGAETKLGLDLRIQGLGKYIADPASKTSRSTDKDFSTGRLSERATRNREGIGARNHRGSCGFVQANSLRRKS